MNRRIITLLGVWLVWHGLAAACPVPVYQYALEHWPTDPYRVHVDHVATLTDDQRDALRFLRRASDHDGMVVNMVLTTRGDAETTRLVVRYPEAVNHRDPIWAGALSMENARALVASPVREQVGNALAGRTSAVWLIVESGDRQRDREVEAVLRRQLTKVERETYIPETAEWGGQRVTLDANVNFTILRVRRDDPAERMLIPMLMASEPDLDREFAGEPMVFPIFGRGLILYALVGRGVNAWTIAEAAKFLTGPCSCQVKALNPGTDLLIRLDWDSRVHPLSPATVGETVGTGSFLRQFDRSKTDEGP